MNRSNKCSSVNIYNSEAVLAAIGNKVAPYLEIDNVTTFSYSVSTGSIEVSTDGGTTYTSTLNQSDGSVSFGDGDELVDASKIVFRALEDNTSVKATAEYI